MTATIELVPGVDNALAPALLAYATETDKPIGEALREVLLRGLADLERERSRDRADRWMHQTRRRKA